MKNLISLLLCILLLSGCAATYDGPTESEYVLTEYTVTHYYDFFDWGEETQTSRTVYAYDIYGNRVREMDYEEGELESVTNVKYDTRGNEISRSNWDHTGWIPLPDGQRKYTYDDRDRLLTTVYFESWGKESSRSTYTYDDEAGSRIWKNDSGDTQTTWLDENGKALREVSGEYETVYEYDENGLRMSWITYQNGQLFDRYQAEYDDKGRQIRGSRYNAAGELQSETRWEYDDDAHTCTIHRPDGRIRCEYFDAEGRIHLIEDYDIEGELTMVQRYTYTEIRVPVKGEDTP